MDGARAERQGTEDVLPRADAAVEMDLDAVTGRIGNRGQLADGRGRPVELAATMVGNDDRLGAGACRDTGVVGIHDALEDELAPPIAADPLDVAPRELEVELARDPLGHGAQIVGPPRVADEVAEPAAASSQHAEAPARPHQHLHDTRWIEARRRRKAVADVLVAL